mgnify:FL=1
MSQWINVCHRQDLQEDSGVCVLINQQQIAVFYISKLDQIFAVGNYDPIAKVNVLSRAMVGDLGGEPMLASPLYKQHYSLMSGQCFEQPEISIPVYPVRIIGDQVSIQVSGA